MFLVDEFRRLLNMCVLVSNDIHEAVFDVRVNPVGRTECLQPDLDAGHRTADADGLASPNGDRQRWKSGFRVYAFQLLEGGFESVTYTREHGRTLSGVGIETGIPGQRLGNFRT